jgi:hypothetical protein
LQESCRDERWDAVIDLCLHRFRLFKLLLNDPSFSREESDLFVALDSVPLSQ